MKSLDRLEYFDRVCQVGEKVIEGKCTDLKLVSNINLVDEK